MAGGLPPPGLTLTTRPGKKTDNFALSYLVNQGTPVRQDEGDTDVCWRALPTLRFVGSVMDGGRLVDQQSPVRCSGSSDLIFPSLLPG